MLHDVTEIAGKHSFDDVYTMLKECNLDPNDSAQRLLYIDASNTRELESNVVEKDQIPESLQPPALSIQNGSHVVNPNLDSQPSQLVNEPVKVIASEHMTVSSTDSHVVPEEESELKVPAPKLVISSHQPAIFPYHLQAPDNFRSLFAFGSLDAFSDDSSRPSVTESFQQSGEMVTEPSQQNGEVVSESSTSNHDVSPTAQEGEFQDHPLPQLSEQVLPSEDKISSKPPLENENTKLESPPPEHENTQLESTPPTAGFQNPVLQPSFGYMPHVIGPHFVQLDVPELQSGSSVAASVLGPIPTTQAVVAGPALRSPADTYWEDHDEYNDDMVDNDDDYHENRSIEMRGRDAHILWQTRGDGQPQEAGQAAAAAIARTVEDHFMSHSTTPDTPLPDDNQLDGVPQPNECDHGEVDRNNMHLEPNQFAEGIMDLEQAQSGVVDKQTGEDPQAHGELVMHSPTSNKNAFKAFIAAEYVGVTNIRWNREFEMGVTNKTPEFLQMNPMGKVPVLMTPEGPICEGNAIARYVARLNTNKETSLFGSSLIENALVDQWIDYATLEIDDPLVTWMRPLFGYTTYIGPVEDAAIEALKKALGVLDTHLADRRFLVGFNVTLADIIMTCNLSMGFKKLMPKDFTSDFCNVERYFWDMIQQPKFNKIMGTLKQAEDTPPITSPWEEAIQQVGIKRPPKVDNPLDKLPGSMFLENWKTTYNKDPGKATEEFENEFNQEGYSIWFCDSKEEHDDVNWLKQLKKKMGTQIHDSSKHVFGKMIILSHSKSKFKVNGLWIFRGQEILGMDKNIPGMELLEWTKVNYHDEQVKEHVDKLLLTRDIEKGVERREGLVNVMTVNPL